MCARAHTSPIPRRVYTRPPAPVHLDAAPAPAPAERHPALSAPKRQKCALDDAKRALYDSPRAQCRPRHIYSTNARIRPASLEEEEGGSSRGGASTSPRKPQDARRIRARRGRQGSRTTDLDPRKETQGARGIRSGRGMSVGPPCTRTSAGPAMHTTRGPCVRVYVQCAYESGVHVYACTSARPVPVPGRDKDEADPNAPSGSTAPRRHCPRRTRGLEKGTGRMRLPTSTWRLVRARERGLGAQASDAKRGRRRKDEDVALRHDSAERKKRRGEPET